MANDPPAPTRTWPFFVFALGMTWLLQLPAVFARWGIIHGPPERYAGVAGLGVFGPVVAALVASRIERGGPGIGAVFRQKEPGRVAPAWYLATPFALPVLYVVARLAYGIAGGHRPVAWIYPPVQPVQFAALVLMPLVEEPGWRGFALPRLQRRYGAVRASVLLGLLWAAWHTTMFILQGFGADPIVFALAMVNVATGSLIFSWFYNRTRGSFWIAFLLHVGAHLNNPTHTLPANAVPFVIYTVTFAIVGTALVFVDRRAWPSAEARTP